MKFIRILQALVIVALTAAIFGTAGYYIYDIFLKPRRMLVEEKRKPLPTPTPDPSLADFEECIKALQSGNLVDARAALEEFLARHPKSSKAADARSALGKINTDIFFSATPSPDKIQYVVQKGDALAKIERKLKTPRELIMRTNNLDDPRKLQIGQVLLVSRPEFSLTIDTKERKLVLFNQSKFFKEYHCKTWKAPPLRTPLPANAKVTEKIAWKNGGRVAFGSREYAGSTHWILVNVPGYTIFGESDGPAEKPPGGVGLAMEEAEELSTLVSRNTPVTIQ